MQFAEAPRLILHYDAASNSFKGTVENTTSGVLDRVRIEVHLSNGTELGPTTPEGHGSRGGGGDQPTCDAGIVHRVDGTCRGWYWRRGERVGRGASGW